MTDFDTSAIANTYNAMILSEAEDYKSQIEAGEFEDREAFFCRLHEDLDGHECVIYTHKAHCVCLVSDNSGAVDDVDSSMAFKDGEIQWSVIAYYAMERDLLDTLDSLGVDVNDDATFDREEEEEDDECEHTRDNDGTCHKCGVPMPG